MATQVETSIDLDRAVQVLGITDMSSVTLDSLANLGRRARKRWHPDQISFRGDEEEIARYTRNFQDIDPLLELVKLFLSGGVQSGPRVSPGREERRQSSYEVLRSEVPRLQAAICAVWDRVKGTKYKHEAETVVLSQGRKIRDVIDEEWQDDVIVAAVIALGYGVILAPFAAAMAVPILNILAPLALLPIIAYFVACILALLPMSRMWLYDWLVTYMLWCVNAGCRLHRFVMRHTTDSDLLLWRILAYIPAVVAQIAKYVVAWPVYQIVKVIWGGRSIGVVRRTINYYAGFADWYVDDLIRRDAAKMNHEELMDLMRMHKELTSCS